MSTKDYPYLFLDKRLLLYDAEEMAGIQEPIAGGGFELTASSTGGTSMPEEPLEPSQGASIIDIAQSRPSLSDSYDIENAKIYTAAIKTIPRESASNRLRLRIRDIKSNKIARRTLQTMIVIGALTVLYQFVSLFPAFQNWHAASRGLQVQIQGEADSRQSLVYEFLTFCENRKVWEPLDLVADLAYAAIQSQNLPLGPDCEKYLGAYPKAPPGTEKWILPQGHYAYFYPPENYILGAIMKLFVALAVCSMVDQRFLRFLGLLKYGCSALGFWKALQSMSARHDVLVCIAAGILLTPVFVCFVVPVSKIAQSVRNAGLVSLFAFVFYLASRGRLGENPVLGTAA